MKPIRTRLFLLLVACLGTLSLAWVRAEAAGLRGVHGTLWVTNATLNSVAAFDAATGQVIAVIPVGRKPIGIEAPPGTGRVYVTNEDDDTVSVIDKATLSVIATIPVGDKPHHTWQSGDGRYVYLGEFGTNKVGVIDTTTNGLVAEYPTSSNPADRSHAPWVSQNGALMLVANSVGNQVAALDPATGQSLWNLNVGANPSEVQALNGLKVGYVSIRNEHKLQILDLKQPAVIGEVSLLFGMQPDTIQIVRGGKLLVIAMRGIPAIVALVEPNRNHAVTLVSVPGSTTGHNAISTNGEYSFVAIESDADDPAGVAIIDHQTRSFVTAYPYPGGGRPHGIYYDNDRR